VATTTENLLTPEGKPPARKRRSFHRRYRKLTLAARILLVAAALIGLPAISHFAYKAFINAQCYSETTDEFGHRYQTEVKSSGCAEPLVNLEEDMRLDAGIAMIGVALLLSSVFCYRRARRYKPRAPVWPHRQK
jgi:hypothetical protein